MKRYFVSKKLVLRILFLGQMLLVVLYGMGSINKVKAQPVGGKGPGAYIPGPNPGGGSWTAPDSPEVGDWTFPGGVEGGGDGSGSRGGGGGGGCFLAGTQVVTPGGVQAIEELKPGDEVVSFDEQGKLVTGEVTNQYEVS